MLRVLLAHLLVSNSAAASLKSQLVTSQLQVQGHQHEDLEFDAHPASTGKKILYVDTYGPFTSSVVGVRSLSMLMDMKERYCNATIDLLTGLKEHKAELVKALWGKAVHDKYFKPLRFWTSDDYRNGTLRLHDYDRIFIGGKLEILEANGTGSFVLDVIRELAEHSSLDRNKVQIFWDEVPFLRCKLTSQKICTRVPGLVKRAAKVASRFLLLTVSDSHRMQSNMRSLNLTHKQTVTTVWPLRFSNMAEFATSLRPAQTFVPGDDPAARSVVVMLGNGHAVNTLMVKYMFNTGAIGAICRSIRNSGSPVRLLFMGGLAEVVSLAAESTTDTDCVDTSKASLMPNEFQSLIQPNVRAWLNPFFEDVPSGVSVRNFAAILTGTPVITSEYGMHGLSDEIFQCKGFPMPANATSPVDFVQFFIDNVVHDAGYLAFLETAQTLSANCVQAQKMTYPIVDGCTRI